jgi:hypothetical protein
MATSFDQKVVAHPEYRRVYDYYVAQGRPQEWAARLAYAHTEKHLTSVPAKKPPLPDWFWLSIAGFGLFIMIFLLEVTGILDQIVVILDKLDAATDPTP